MQAAVRGNDAVAVEGAVRRVVVVQVTAENVDVVGAGGVGRPAQGLVLEVPDEAALATRFTAGNVPVLLEVAHRVTHGVRILALDEGLVPDFQVSLHLVRGIVHRAVDIRVPVAGTVPVDDPLLILDGTGRIEGLDPVVTGLEIRTGTGLVAHAPDNDGRMVEIATDHPAVTGHVGGGEERVLRQGFRPVAHAVGFDVSLIHHIQAILVAQGEPARIIGIVAGADGIDIQFLHDPDVPDHLGLGDHIAAGGAQFMPVHALDEDGLAVHFELVADDFHGTETEVDTRALGHSLLGGSLDLERVQAGGFGAPQGRIPDRACILDHPLGRLEAGFGEDLPSGGIQDFQIHGSDAPSDFQGHFQAAVGPSGHMDILQALLLTGIDLHAAGDAGETPEILVLQIRAVAPAEDLEGDGILTGLDELRQVEAGFQLAVLAVADHLSVHPHADVGRGRTNHQADLLPDPGAVHGEGPAVLAHIVVLQGRIGRIVLVMAAPGIADVHVHRVAEALEVPQAGDRDFVPARVVIAHGFKAFQASFDRRVEMELPEAVQAQGLLLGGDEGRPHGHPVLFKDIRVLPGFQGGFRRKGQESGRKGQGKDEFSHYRLSGQFV